MWCFPAFGCLAIGGFYSISVYDINPYVAVGCRADAEDRIMGEIEEESLTEMTAEVSFVVRFDTTPFFAR